MKIKFTRLRMTLNNYEHLNEILQFVKDNKYDAINATDTKYRELIDDWKNRGIDGIDAKDIQSTLKMIELVDIENNNELSELGEEILAKWDEQETIKNIIAEKMLFEKQGWAYCHILFHLSGKKREDLQLAYQEYYNEDVAAELVDISKYNIFLSWLGIAKEEGNNYTFDTLGFKKRTGIDMDEFDSLSDLTKDTQWCYLALIRLSNGKNIPIGIGDIKDEVEILSGKFQAALTQTIGSHQTKLEEKELITTSRPNGTNRGDSTDWTLKNNLELNDKVFAPMLETFCKNRKDLRTLKLFDVEFKDIILEMDSADKDTRGRALETFAAKVCWILGIRNIEIRKLDGIESDVVGNKSSPFYTTFLVQCKNQKDHVGKAIIVKELGTAFKEKYNNILIFATSGYSGGTQDFCNEIMVKTGVNIYLFGKEDIKKIIERQTALLGIISEKNKQIEITRSNIDPIIQNLTKIPKFVTQMEKMGWTPPNENTAEESEN